ncbi:hypothetical protein AALP_AA6G191100 [Arabis alpina]|uniref:DUF6821 domain-containing protein n=1 Tax=Arabis alpina TaxID=50452 RepID=A0A087GQ78_ARAAL|nr:hypothetical protein AALP_AA6G191100 [Arabis alpina]
MEADWEMVHGSDTESTDSITEDKLSESFDDGLILSDHFSSGETTDPSLVESGDSFRVDSSSGPLDVSRSDDASSVRNESGFDDLLCGTGDGGEATDENLPEVEAVAELAGGGTVSHYDDALEEEAIEDLSKSFSDSGGNEMVSADSGVVNGEEEIVSDNGVVASTEETQGNEESKSKEIVWWKMPFVLLKYSAFRIGPVWSVSIAAAVMGFVLLGRRLYNMKKKAQRFNLKVTIDDKKVSRVMSQAARLNEVFTEVRRVPVIRPALPSPGAWPVLSLR